MTDTTDDASRAAARPLLSIVVPVFNEEACIPLFYERCLGALGVLEGVVELEFIFMNNRSTDRSANVVTDLRRRDPRVQLVTLSKNVGYQASVQAGLRQAAGDAIVIIDVDCEDPPELIPTFVQAWQDGADVVYGERGQRPEPGWLIATRRLFYRLNKLVADSDIVLDMAEFGLMSAAVRDAVLANDNTFPFVRGEVASTGFDRHAVAYDRSTRVAGHSHYNLVRMTAFAIAGILSSTTLPLRAALYALALVLPTNLAWCVWWLFDRNLRIEPVVILNLSYISTALAFACLYLARTYRNGIGRPMALVDWRRSLTNTPPERSGNHLRSRGTPRLMPR